MHSIRVDMELSTDMLAELNKRAEAVYLPVEQYMELVLKEVIEESETP